MLENLRPIISTFRELDEAKTSNIANAKACLLYFLCKTRSMFSYYSDEYNYSGRLALRPVP